MAELLRRDANVIVAEVDGKPLLLNLRSWTYVSFNDTAARIWELLETARGRDDLLGHLLAEYDAGDEEIAAELDGFLALLREQGMIAAVQ